ncbi:MAG: hypothetical protein SPF30_05350 [Arcanobacterium sp.]|nr:hypothetical protein [Arcanobacterium sp.]
MGNWPYIKDLHPENFGRWAAAQTGFGQRPNAQAKARHMLGYRS